MRKYKVTFQFTGEMDVEVRARTMEEAISAARTSEYQPSQMPVQDVQVVKAEEVY
jgi:hypothetical protein